MSKLIHKPQEIPLEAPDSSCLFQPSDEKPFLATPAAIGIFGKDTIVHCLRTLRQKAQEHQGLDYLQVFEDPQTHERLWFIEDGDGGAITALLPSEH